MNISLRKLIDQSKDQELTKTALHELENLEALIPEIVNCVEVIDHVARIDDNYPQSKVQRDNAIENIEGANGLFFVTNRAIIDALKAKRKITA